MNRCFASLVLAAALSGASAIAPAQLQAQDEYDTFGIVDDSATIDPAVPEGSGIAPPLPAPLVGNVPATPEPPVAGPDAVPVTKPPSDWQPFNFAEITAWMPPDFTVMQENDEGTIYFGGDKDQMKGHGFGVILLPSDEFEEIPPNASLLVDKQVSLDGKMMRWREFTIEDGGLKLATIMVSHPRPTEPDLSVALAATAYNMPLEQARAKLTEILGTVRVGVAPNHDQVGVALIGLVGYDAPKDWRVDIGPQGQRVGFSPRGYSGYVAFSRGLAVTGAGGADEDIPAGVTPTPAKIYGQPADLYSWTQDHAEFYVGARMVPGQIAYYRLKACPDGVALGVVIAGAPEAIDSEEFRAVLGKFTLNLPAELTPCPAATKTSTKSGAAETPRPTPTGNATPAPAPAQASTDASPSWGEDVFEDDTSGYMLYRNARYGFSISYPGTYFTAEAPPGNGDGRRFNSVDGQASFLVYAQYEALGRDLTQTMLEDRQGFGHITSERVEPGAYELSGIRDGQAVYRRILRDHDDMTRMFEITYPTTRQSEFQAVVAHMGASFAPPPSLIAAPISVPQPPTTPKQQIVATPIAPIVGHFYTPARGTGERAALMDAARVPIVPAIGQHVIFVVDVLNSDGHWAYLQATPVNPNGTNLDWSRTNFARDWATDVMSDIVMVLIRNEGGQWQAVDWVIGPTDVAWYDWVTRYGLPERLFGN